MGFLLTCLSIILTYFSPSELVPSLAPFHLQLVIILVGIVLSLTTFALRPVRALQGPQYLLVLGFWAAIVISQVSKLKIRWAYEGMYEFAVLAAVYFLVNINVFSLRRVKMASALLVVCGVILGIEAILAYHTGYQADKLLLFPADDYRALYANRVRAYGILQDPNDFGQFLLVCFALLGMFWKPKRTFGNVLLLAAPATILLYTIYLTFSRGALLGLGAVLFFALYRKGRQLIAGVAAGIGLILLYALKFTGGREIALDNTTAGRIVAWGAGISATLRHPLFGVGFGRFLDINDITAHNSFVLCFTELGLFGYFFWMALILITLKSLWPLAELEIKAPEDENYVGAVRSIRAAFFAFLTTSWFLSRTYNETFYILVALCASLIQLRAYAVPKFQFGQWASRTIMWEFASIVAVYAMVKMRMFQ